MGFLSNKKAKKEQKEKEKTITFEGFPHLLKLKPKERYVFHSDYFEVDSYVACVMSFFHTEAAADNFGAFWGINRIPSGLPDGVTTINFEQISRMTEGWLIDHQARSEGVAEMNANSQDQTGSNTSKHKAQRSHEDLSIIAKELNDGASYLHVHYRLLVKAPDLKTLDDAVAKIERLYVDRFGTLSASAYPGEQRRELSSLFNRNRRKKGKGYYFTSTEFAGSYSLVTHGLEDPAGEYVGYMVGDVNNSAVLFDVDNYRHHVVVASEQFNEARGRAHVADMWGSKISQACLLNSGRTVHLILDGANLNRLGPDFERLTHVINMDRGDVNMFEMFGDVNDELSVFPAQMQKLILMAEQAYETTDSDRSVIRGSLEDVATKFYVDNRMWRENAGSNRSKLRVVGIPHEQIPKLEMFVSYLDMEYKALVNSDARDDEKLHAMSILSTTFRNMLSNNGDLFNTTTNPNIDGAVMGRRVIYDFSKLMLRGIHIAMAQLVNIISFAVGNLNRNDVVIIHGAELIDPTVRDYLNTQFDRLYDRGGKVAFCYNDISKMLRDQDFNHFDKADYTILGNMSETIVQEYQDYLGSSIPADLAKLITDKSDAICYIRRGFDNVVFKQDLRLDPKTDNDARQGRNV